MLAMLVNDYDIKAISTALLTKNELTVYPIICKLLFMDYHCSLCDKLHTVGEIYSMQMIIREKTEDIKHDIKANGEFISGRTH